MKGAGAWSFGYLFLPLPLLVSLVPFPTLAVLDCERTNVRPQSNCPRHLPTKQPLASFLCVMHECDNILPRPFGSHKPTPNQYHLPLPFLIFCQCFIKHYDQLHSITLYLPISAPFLPPSLSVFLFYLRLNYLFFFICYFLLLLLRVLFVSYNAEIMLVGWLKFGLTFEM